MVKSTFSEVYCYSKRTISHLIFTYSKNYLYVIITHNIGYGYHLNFMVSSLISMEKISNFTHLKITCS